MNRQTTKNLNFIFPFTRLNSRLKRISFSAILALGFCFFPFHPFAPVLFAEPEKAASSDEQLLGVEEEMKTDEMGEKTQKKFEEMFLAPEEFAESGSKHARKLSESPSAVTVLNKDDIKAYAVSTLEEFLRIVPGVQVKGLSPANKTLGIRGFTTVGGNKVLVLIDGQEINSNFFGGVFWRLLPISLDDIERIEVIRGPASNLYGANAFAGVINIVTENPQGLKTATLISEVGAYDNGLGTMFFKGKLARQYSPFSILASADFNQFQSTLDPDQTNAQVFRARVKALYEPAADARIQLDLAYLLTKWDYYSQFMYLNFKLKPTFYLNTVSTYKNLKFQANYRRLYLDADVVAPTFLIQYFIPQFNSYMDNLEGRLEYTQKLPGRNRLTLGTGYLMNIFYSNILAKTYNDEKRFEGFFQDEWNIQKNLFFTAGLRYDYNSVTNQSFSPRASLVYFFRPEHNLRFSYGQAFRKPSFFEYGMRLKSFQEIGRYIDIFNKILYSPGLKNEKISTYEIGYQGHFFRRLEASLTGFYSQYRDAIVITKTFGFTNDPEYADYYGGELSLKFYLLSNLDGFFNYSLDKVFKRTKQKTYLPLEDFAPKHVFNFGFRLKPLPRLLLSLSGNYVSQNQDFIIDPDKSVLIPVNAPPQKLGPYFLLNCRVGYQLWKDRLEVGVKAFNLLNDNGRQMPSEVWHRADGQTENIGGEPVGRTITGFVEASF
ncbi:MAG: TonB-dependent receptor [bacterium]|nr:TonB-dependent receptor [bacterium]